MWFFERFDSWGGVPLGEGVVESGGELEMVLAAARGEHGKSTHRVGTVTRLSSLRQWKQFCVARDAATEKSMRTGGKCGSRVDRWMFHTTAAANVNSIVVNGFKIGQGACTPLYVHAC